VKLGVAPDFHEALDGYNWPGNVRELFMALDSAIARSTGFSTLFSAHLPPQVRLRAGFDQPGVEKVVTAFSDFTGKTMEEARVAALEVMERAYLDDLRSKHPGDFPSACKASGLSQSRLYALLKKHGLSLSAAPKGS
jgi:two-component system NtrC family response regulator